MTKNGVFSLNRLFFFVLALSLSTQGVHGWIHHLKLQNDERRHISLTSAFGILKDGTMAVNLTAFTFEPANLQNLTHSFGFTLGKSRSSSIISSMENSPECKWSDEGKTLESIYLRFDLESLKVIITHAGTDLQNITISELPRTTYLYQQGLAHGVIPPEANKKKPAAGGENKAEGQAGSEAKVEGQAGSEAKVEGQAGPAAKPKVEGQAGTEAKVEGQAGSEPKPTVEGQAGSETKGEIKTTAQTGTTTAGKGKTETPASPTAKPAGSSRQRRQAPNAVPTAAPLQTLTITSYQEGSKTVYQTHFLIHVKQQIEEGLYSLFFHNCAKHQPRARVNLSLTIVQDNNGNYLSSDEMPIPAMYFMLSVVFFILSLMWLSVLRKATEGVYKIHYLMLTVVLFKSLSCLFHGVNLYMIQRSGIHVDAWAILWYIVYLMRGALMFLTILLIGAGWVFIKHVFTDREKKLFLVIIPLQILDNVAWVIMEESEEGNTSYDLWRKIFIGVDLLCCFTILFPVVWSIRHLQEASKTDGKAAMNLVKLKLFRHYYFLVVCYIYFTRIIKYFLAITLPFHYGWLSVLFTEVFLLVFFVLIGYKFRPTIDNPYLQVPQDSDDEDIEMDEVLTKTGASENVVRVNVGRNEEQQQQQETAMKQRESSHEYD